MSGAAIARTMKRDGPVVGGASVVSAVLGIVFWAALHQGAAPPPVVAGKHPPAAVTHPARPVARNRHTETPSVPRFVVADQNLGHVATAPRRPVPTEPHPHPQPSTSSPPAPPVTTTTSPPAVVQPSPLASVCVHLLLKACVKL